MKINCGPSYVAKCAAREQWHDFFPLWPRRVGENDCRWLETIERKGQYLFDSMGGSWSYQYRTKDKV